MRELVARPCPASYGVVITADTFQRVGYLDEEHLPHHYTFISAAERRDYACWSAGKHEWTLTAQ